MLDVTILDLQFLSLEKTISSFLIKTSDGPILIEAGPHSTIAALEAGLLKHRVSIDEIRHVFLTHIHLDHAGAAWYFAKKGANIYVHPFGLRHLADPSKLMDSARRIYQDKMDYLWGEMHAIDSRQLLEVADREVIEVGGTQICALHTPGHAAHHIAWKIDGVLFAGDVAGVKIENGPVVPPCPPPDINIEDWKASLVMIRSESVEGMYLTHFGLVTNVNEHLTQLEGVLDDWATWIRVKMDTGLTADEMTPIFQKYVESGLKSKGLTASQIAQYEAANPAWMSVAGLIRYWSKKQSQEQQKLQ